MKKMKKLASVALALVMALALMVPAMAAEPVPTEGSITINHAVKGETYKIVKLFDAKVSANANDESGVTYTMPGDDPSAIPEGLGDYFTWNADKQTIVATDAAKSVDGSLSAAAQTALKTWAEGQTIPAKDTKVAGANSTIEFTGLELGYYVVLSSVDNGTAIAVTSTNPNPSIYEKNADQPGSGENDGKTVGTDKTYAVGEDLDYTVRYTTVNWVGTGEDAKQVTKYTIDDDLANGALTLKGNITVTVADATVATANKFPVVIDWIDENGNSIYDNKAEMVVTYTATVNQIVADGVKNGVTITSDAGTSDKYEETVYTGNLTITKVDGNDNSVLADAEFALYKYENGNKLYRTVAANGVVGWSANVNDAQIVKTGNDGKATIEGLATGTYYLEETKAPAGYNKITEETDMMKVEVAENLTADVAIARDIANYTGTVLPATGGMGTTLFYTMGGLLVACSAILLVTKKRMG